MGDPKSNRLCSSEELAAAGRELPGWQFTDKKLHKVYTFPDFPAAMGFMAEVAVHAQRLNHHPNWSNVYNRVDVEIFSHDLGGVTPLCLTLAQACETAQAAYAGTA